MQQAYEYINNKLQATLQQIYKQTHNEYLWLGKILITGLRWNMKRLPNLTDGPNAFKVQPRNIILDQMVRIKFALGDTNGSSFRMNIKFNYSS